MTSIVTLALAGVAIAMVSNRIEAYATKVNKADGMTLQFTSQLLGGTKSAYSFEAAKPNMLRLDTPASLFVTDGKTMTTYVKGINAYYNEPFDPASITAAVQDFNLVLVRPFFNDKALKGLSVRSGAMVTRKGFELTPNRAVLEKDSGLAGVFYTDENNLVRQAELNFEKETTILDVSTINLNRPSDSRFTFLPPKGAKEVNKSELGSTKWYTNIAEALADAKSSNRMVMLEFWFDG